MSKVVITGAGGFLGLAIAKNLIKRFGDDIEIINISRNHYVELDALNIKTFQCDISDFEKLKEFDFNGVEAIFHVAAKAGVWGRYNDFYKINTQGSLNILKLCDENKIKMLIYTSSPSVVFGKDDILKGDEKLSYPKRFYTYYAETKKEAEEQILAANSQELKTLAIRPHLIWGEGDPHLVPRIIQKAKLGKLKKVGDGLNQVDIIHVENAASAHVLAYLALRDGKKIGGNAYFVGQERPVYLWEFIDKILSRKNIMPLKDQVSFKTAYWLGFLFEKIFKFCGIYSPEPPMTRFVSLQLAKSHYFSHEKAKRDFGYEPLFTIEEGLDKTFPKT